MFNIFVSIVIGTSLGYGVSNLFINNSKQALNILGIITLFNIVMIIIVKLMLYDNNILTYTDNVRLLFWIFFCSFLMVFGIKMVLEFNKQYKQINKQLKKGKN